MLSGRVIRSRHGGLCLGENSRRRRPGGSCTGRVESCSGGFGPKLFCGKEGVGVSGGASHRHESKAGRVVGTTRWCGGSAQGSAVSGQTEASVDEMTLKCFQKLQNGSDIRGVALQCKFSTFW